MADSQDVMVVLVHGAGAGGWIWTLLAEQLDLRGVAHLAVDLPTVGEGADAGLDVHADAAYVRSVLDGLDRPVVLCGNSYGGAVITEAAAGQPNVVRLVYLAAFMPDADDALFEFFTGNTSPESATAIRFRDDGLVEFDADTEKRLAMQQASADVAEWAAGQLGPMAMGSGGSPTVTAVGWRDVPSTFVVCSEDRSILPEAQRRWATERATDSVEQPWDHCPQLSHPAEVADLLVEIARGSVGATTPA
ncbi:MAG: alpha/beta fold hydrolase [Acidimicrobiales bacterium]